MTGKIFKYSRVLASLVIVIPKYFTSFLTGMPYKSLCSPSCFDIFQIKYNPNALENVTILLITKGIWSVLLYMIVVSSVNCVIDRLLLKIHSTAQTLLFLRYKADNSTPKINNKGEQDCAGLHV